MGCDWHFAFDQRINNKWEMIWEPELDDEWYISIVENDPRYDDVNVGDEGYKKLCLEYEALPTNEVLKRYLDKGLRLAWTLPEYEILYKDYKYNKIKSRDYNWFGFIAGVRNNAHQSWESRGFPEDAHPYIKSSYKAWEGDAHTPSWLIVKEIFDNPKCNHFWQVKWLKKHIENPHLARLIFWFDN